MFAQSLREQGVSRDKLHEELSHMVHVVERELGVLITEDYLLMKFFNQLEEIKWYREQEKKENDKYKNRVR